MSVSPVIEIDVDTSKFETFNEEFNDYCNAVGAANDAWKGMNKLVSAQTEVMHEVMDLLRQQSDILSGIVASQNASTEAAARQNTAFERLSHTTSKISSGLKSVTSSLAHLGVAGVAAAGLGGIFGLVGSLFGLEKLANDAGNNRRESTGIGVSSGTLNSFETNYAPYGSGKDLLQNVADANRDLSKQWALTTNGIQVGDDEQEQALAVQRRAREVYQREGGNHHNLTQDLQAHGFDVLGIDANEATRLGRASDKEFDTMQNNTRRDSRVMNVSDETNRKWQELNVQLDRAKTTVENSLIESLAPLAPEIKSLSDSLSGFIHGELNDRNVKAWVGDIASALHWAADKLHDPEVKAAIEGLPDQLEYLFKRLGALTTALGYNPDGDQDPNHGATYNAVKGAGRWLFGEAGAKAAGETYDVISKNPLDTYRDLTGKGPRHPVAGAEAASAMSNYDPTLPKGLLYGLWGMESSFGTKRGRNPMPGSTASGDFQITDAFAKDNDVKDRNDIMQAMEGVAKYERKELKAFNGNQDLAILSYHIGHKGVMDEVGGDMEHWRDHLTKSDIAYLNQTKRFQQDGVSAATGRNDQTHPSIMSAIMNKQTPAQQALAASRSTAKVRIENRAGASVTAAARQARGPRGA